MADHTEGRCPHCLTRLRVPNGIPKIKCPKCSKSFAFDQLDTRYYDPFLRAPMPSRETTSQRIMTTPHTLTKPERPYVDWSFFIGGSVPIVLICLAWFSLGIPSWLVIPALCIGCGAAAWGVYLWFLISEFHSRLVSEHEKAKGNRYDEQTQRQLAQKHYRKLLKRADEIKTEHDERFADDRWIAYLKSRLSGEAGQYVLDYYHQEMALLHKAQNVHSEISPEAMSINKTKHKARKEAARHFAQLDIDKESEKRLKEKKSRSKYWDD